MKTEIENNYPEINPAAVIEGQSAISKKRRRIVMMNCSEVIRQFGNIKVFKFTNKEKLRIEFNIFSDRIVPLIQQLRSRKIINKQQLTDYRIHPAPNENMLVMLNLKLQ
jgi:hypothetical protein